MSLSVVEAQYPRAESVTVTGDSLSVNLLDGRTIIVPLTWFPRLCHATPSERNQCRIAGGGTYLHWPEIDEDLTVMGLLEGKKSGESAESLKKWLASRNDSAQG